MTDANGLIYQYPEKTSLVRSSGFRHIVNSYLRQPVSLPSIYQLSRDIIELYRRNTQSMIDVLITEQNISGGTLRIIVIEGRMGSVKYGGLEDSKPESLNLRNC